MEKICLGCGKLQNRNICFECMPDRIRAGKGLIDFDIDECLKALKKINYDKRRW